MKTATVSTTVELITRVITRKSLKMEGLGELESPTYCLGGIFRSISTLIRYTLLRISQPYQAYVYVSHLPFCDFPPKTC